MDWSTISDFSADGTLITLDESGDATEGAEGESLVYIRKTDGSPAVRMAAKSSARALSRDGKLLLTAVDEQNDTKSAFELLPIRPSAPIRIETGLQSPSTRVAWLPQQTDRLRETRQGGKLRTWVQALDGKPQPITARR